MPKDKIDWVSVKDNTRPEYIYPGEVAVTGRVTARRMYSLAASPTKDNDGFDSAGIGFSVYQGDSWNDTANDVLYFCMDNSQGDAVWRVAFSAIGGKVVKTVTSAAVTLDRSAEFIAVSYTDTGAVALTMPSAETFWDDENVIGYELIVADTGANSSLNNITITANGSDTITYDTTGQTSVVISGDGVVVRFITIDSTTWKVW